MTQNIARAATEKIIGRLTGDSGLAASLRDLSDELATAFDDSHVHAANTAADVAAKTTGVRYPAVYVYCEKLANNMVEKFRRFSGRAQAAIDVRLTGDRPEHLASEIEMYIDAVTDVLTRNRGDWSDGFFYSGKYEVVFVPVKHGGKNFIESAKVVFDIEVSK
jgi:hypothetical protein